MSIENKDSSFNEKKEDDSKADKPWGNILKNVPLLGKKESSPEEQDPDIKPPAAKKRKVQQSRSKSRPARKRTQSAKRATSRGRGKAKSKGRKTTSARGGRKGAKGAKRTASKARKTTARRGKAATRGRGKGATRGRSTAKKTQKRK